MLLKFNEEWARSSVNGALAIRKDINRIVDEICAQGYRNICWLGIGGTWASGMQAAVHMKEQSEIETWAENASEYNTTGNKRVGEGTVVITSSVTGSTVEVVEAVKRMQAAGAKVIGFIDIDTTELAKLVDYEIVYPVNEQLKFFMVADRFMQNNGEFSDCDAMYAEFEAHLAQALIDVEKKADAIIDTRDYELKGISEGYRKHISHLVMHAVNNRIDAYMERETRHPMDIRRYYRRLDY